MKAGSKKLRSIRNRLRSRAISAGRRRKTRRNRRKQRGGYAQYQNNLPMTQTYQVAGINLPSNELGLANPPPIRVLPNTGQCTDNYSHYTNQGFPSKGH